MGWINDSIEVAWLDTSRDPTPDGKVSADPDDRIQFVKSELSVLPDCAQKETIGQTSQGAESWWCPRAFLGNLRSIIRSPKAWPGGMINRRKEDAICKDELRIAHLPDSKKSIASSPAYKWDAPARMRAMQALVDNEGSFLRFFEESSAVMFLADPTGGVIIAANQAASSYYGYMRRRMAGMRVSQINIMPLRDVVREQQRAVRERRNFCNLLHRHSCGKQRMVEVYSAPVYVEGKSLLLSIVNDVIEPKQAQVALVTSEERYRTLFQTSRDCITISDLKSGKIVDVNKAFVEIMGFENKEAIGRTALELGIWEDIRDRQPVTEMLRQNTNCENVEVRFRKKNGEVFTGLISATLISVDDTMCILSCMRDISGAKVAEKEIKKLSFYDQLTNLPNRRLLLDRLRLTADAHTRRSGRRALLFVDPDDFKTLNDTLGNHSGDLVLQEIARRLTTCLREDDTVARLSGDEFVVLLEDLSETLEDALAQAKAVAEKVLAIVDLPYQLDGRECRITACIGITVFGNDLESASEALQQADLAMHQAKAAGRDSMHFFVPALQTAVNARALMEEDLRLAMSGNQFLLYYQPQMDRGRLIGAEALLRWNHPKRGIVPPDEFIPLAEETGLILPLGNWVLETACKQIAAWAGQKETDGITVSVNISAHQFRQSNFVEQVLSALRVAGANPRNLKLELTESMLVNNIEDVIAKMMDLKRVGLRFSVDDFGTGYSSLTYLKRLPLDQLKIDRSFVRDILMDAGSGAIAQTIISLSKAMGFSVIAEGVETEEQRGFLSSMGCHSFQGYLFSRPLPLEEFQLMLPALAYRKNQYAVGPDGSHRHLECQ